VSTLNWQAVKFWHSVAVTRIILSRELSLDEIEDIRQLYPEIEIDVLYESHILAALLSVHSNNRDPTHFCTVVIE
jgi:putative protease